MKEALPQRSAYELFADLEEAIKFLNSRVSSFRTLYPEHEIQFYPFQKEPQVRVWYEGETLPKFTPTTEAVQELADALKVVVAKVWEVRKKTGYQVFVNYSNENTKIESISKSLLGE